MKNPETKRKLLQRLILVILLIPVVILLSLHFYENYKITQFVKRYKLEFKEKSKKNAFIVSDTLRNIFNTNIKSWNPDHQDFGKQPYFRRSVLQILKDKEAVCGGGTRVLCRILQSIGYDATRVVLFTSSFGLNVHTLVSIVINGKEYFIDSLNSPDDLNSTLKNYDINSSTIKMVPYNKRSLNPESLIFTSRYFPVRIFQDIFIAYSYEAIPLSKLLNTIGIKTYVLNYHRPPLLISMLAESVYLIYLMVYMLTIIILFCLIQFIKSFFPSFSKLNWIFLFKNGKQPVIRR